MTIYEIPIERDLYFFVMELVSTTAFTSIVGFALAFALAWMLTRKNRIHGRKEAESVIAIARRESELEVKEHRSQLNIELEKQRMEGERVNSQAELELDARLREIRSHEESIAALDHELEVRERSIENELKALESRKAHLEELIGNVRRTMTNLASMDVEDIKEALRQEVREDCAEELRRMRKDMIERSELDIKREANRTLITAMQRIASKPNNEITAAVVQLPNDDMKGRIIGREGRNIKCFETATGTTLLIDESPQMVLVSSFDPVRREIAKCALERLVKDGRIHPASIEEFVSEARNDVDQIIEQAGDGAVSQLKISRMHPEIVGLLGKLRFRNSYSQNDLEHSIEVGFLCSLIASELGLDPNIAKRAGLLHDIGKAIDGEYEGSHALVGADFVKARGEDEIVVNAVAAHHEEVVPESIYAGLVILADTISAVRPGARAETISAYIDRLRNLEELALSFDGVLSAYAIQAGREIRVVVNPKKVTDDIAVELSRSLRERIEDELEYPNSIRITVIREQRFTETAK